MTKQSTALRKGAGTRGRKPTKATLKEDADPGVTAQIFGAQRKLWSAGVTALSRSGKIAGPMGGTAIAESLQGGLKKLEEVFDQRVLSSLAHAGMPSPNEIRQLMERVESLAAEVDRLSRRRSKK
jgi:hypothetical protein